MDPAELRGVLESSAGVIIMCPDSGDAQVKESLNVAFSEMSAKKHKVCTSCSSAFVYADRAHLGMRVLARS